MVLAALAESLYTLHLHYAMLPSIRSSEIAYARKFLLDQHGPAISVFSPSLLPTYLGKECHLVFVTTVFVLGFFQTVTD